MCMMCDHEACHMASLVTVLLLHTLTTLYDKTPNSMISMINGPVNVTLYILVTMIMI